MKTTKRLYRTYHVRQAIMYFLAVWAIFATVPFTCWADVNPASNALPNGILPGTTVGAGNFDRTVLNKLTINNVQNGAVVNWKNFDIGSAATVNINQASASAAMLNRVFDGNPTGIMGTLNANGRVFIINPAGVLFGAGSSVNVNQLIASSLNITDADFLNGINTGQFNFEGGIPGINPSQQIGIINNGTITGTEGVALIGQKILNNGAIVTSNGGYVVVMAAGDKVVLGQPGSKIIVEMASSTSNIEGTGSVTNNTTGSITSPGGQIVLAAGDIYSAAMNTDTKAVKVDGGNGRVAQLGTINAGSGSVSLTAGDMVALGSDSRTTANAGTNGNGGEVIIYSPDTALFHDGAVVEAKGGSLSGNGGFVEVSAKTSLSSIPAVDTRAPHGETGMFLIDPTNLSISISGNDFSGSNWNWNTGELANLLNGNTTDVTLATTGGWIKVMNDLIYNSPRTLTFNAGTYIEVEAGAPITNTGNGKIALNAKDYIIINGTIQTGGDMDIIADKDHIISAPKDEHDFMYSNAPLSAGGNIQISGNDIVFGDTVTAGKDITITGRQCESDTTPDWGNVWAKKTLTAGGDIVISDTGYYEDNYYPGTITLDGDVTAVSGNLSLFNDTYTGNGITLKAGKNILLQNGGTATDPIGYPGYCSVLTGTHALTLWAGNEIVAPDTVISVTGSTLTMHQGLDLNLKNYTFANQTNTDLTLISDNSSVTADETKLANAADKWHSIGATANQNITLVGNGGSITLGNSGTDATKSLWAKNGNIGVTAGYNVIAGKDITADKGNVDIEAKHGIDAQNISSGGDMTLHADTDNYWGNNVVAHGFLDAVGTMYIEGTNVYLQGAQSGHDMTLYAHGLWKLSHPGDQIIAGGDVDVTGELTSGGGITITADGFNGTPSVTGPTFTGGTEPYTSNGSIYLHDKATAAKNITLTAGKDVHADVLNAGRNIDIYSSDFTTYLHGNDTAVGDITLHNNTIADDGVIIDAGHDVILADGKTLTGNGALTVEADRDITLGGAVTTSVVTNGDLKIDADADTDSIGNIHAKSTITNMGGKIDISGVGVDLDGAVKAKNDILVSGVSGGDMGHVNAYGPLTSEDGKIDVFSDWYINLSGAVDAHTDLILKADALIYGNSYINAYSTLMAQTGKMEVSADESINLQDIATAGGDMTLNADLDNDGTGNLNVNGLVAVGTINMTAGDSTINIHKSADMFAPADVKAGSDIYLNNKTVADDGVIIDAGHDAILADGKTLDGLGNLTVQAGHNVILGGAVTTVQDMTLNAGSDMIAKSDLTSTKGSINIYSSDSTTYLGGDVIAYGNVSLNDNTVVNGSDTQTIKAQTGTLTAQGFIHKVTEGDMWLIGGSPTFAVDLRHNSTDGQPAASTCLGNLWIIGQGDVQISGDLTTFDDGDDWCRPTGGVAVYSKNGKIYTSGGADDTINVSIKGSSNHSAQTGIYDAGIYGKDYDPFAVEGGGLVPRAAIVIMSHESLNIGSGAQLHAYGKYYDDVDDRAAIDFLDVPADIPLPGAYPRNQGVPFDLAIYVASLNGDVDVSAPVSIMSCKPIEEPIGQQGQIMAAVAVEPQCELVPKGAMVIDAKTNVTFDGGVPGGPFEASLASGNVGDRLEVCSRITEWLEGAVGRLPYALDILNGNPLPFPPGYAYILRGAGLDPSRNPVITDGRAWVLVPQNFLIADDFDTISWSTEDHPVDVLANDDSLLRLYNGEIINATQGGGKWTLGVIGTDDHGGAIQGFIYTPPKGAVFVWDGIVDAAGNPVNPAIYTDTFTYQAEKVVNGVTIHSTNIAKVTIDVTNFLPVPGNADTTIHMVTTTNGAPDAKFVLGTNPIITDIDGSPEDLVLGLGDGPTPHTGTPSISGNIVTYHPLDGYVTGGTPDSFEYTVNDKSIVSATATPVVRTGTLKVAITDTLPTGSGDLGSTPEGTALTVTQNGVSKPVGVVDQDNGLDTLSHIIGTYNGSAGGKLEFDGTKWIYTPAQGYVGSEEFTINVWDGQNKYMFVNGEISSVVPEYGNGTVTVTVTAEEIKPILSAAPLPVIRLPEISGCPELMGAVAMELGINPADIQVAIGNSLTDTPDTQPCEACKKVVNYAGILKDSQGQHMAAMVQVFNQLAPANTPYSPEMGAMIANAFADYKNNPDMPQYATAMEYVDAFVEYAKVLDTELGAPVGDSTAFVLEKYGSNLTKAENENIYMYIQAQLGKSKIGPIASLSN